MVHCLNKSMWPGIFTQVTTRAAVAVNRILTKTSGRTLYSCVYVIPECLYRGAGVDIVGIPDRRGYPISDISPSPLVDPV